MCSRAASAITHTYKDMQYQIIDSQVLIIGGGIAGCNAAMAAAKAGAQVTVMEKATLQRSGDVGGGVDHFLAYLESGEPWDTREAFLEHIWEAGGGTGDPEIIDGVCCRGLKEAIPRMARIGVPLTQPDGSFYRTRSFGQPGPYFINFNGKRLKPALAREVKRLGCKVLNKTMALGLLVEDGRVCGAAGFNVRSGELLAVQAPAVVIATGDSSRLFENPRINPFNTWASPFNTGDGQAMAFRAGAKLANLEFMRLSLTPKGFAAAGFNAFMGLGCRLMNAAGEYYMESRADGKNPPRNAAVQYSLQEIREGRGPVYVDCRHLSPQKLDHLEATLGYDKDTLPDFIAQKGENLRKRPLEIGLSDGSQGGVSSVTGAGICIDRQAAASLPGLFAAGNCADHNRGLWAATTGGYQAGKAAAAWAEKIKDHTFNMQRCLKPHLDFRRPLEAKEGVSYLEVEEMIRKVMSEHCGYMRSREGLDLGLAKLAEIEGHLGSVKVSDPHYLMRAHESRSLLIVGGLMMRAARFRTESRMQPFHCRLDFPKRDDRKWFGLVEIRQEEGGVKLSFRDLGARRSAGGEG
jgi:adenylylsulfate reductase subunit A